MWSAGASSTTVLASRCAATSAAMQAAGAVLRATGSSTMLAPPRQISSSCSAARAMLMARQDDRLPGNVLSHSAAGLLKQRLVACDLVELLGQGFARKRPEARARSSAKDERQYLTHNIKLEYLAWVPSLECSPKITKAPKGAAFEEVLMALG